MNKSEIRKRILKLRSKKNCKSLKINYLNIFKILRKYKIKGKVVGGYYPYNHEINAIEVLENFEKKNFKIALPRIKKNSQMDFYSWSTKDPLEINKFGIPEPISHKKVIPSILLVPLVAFDKNYNRIGYGGGFYDRYIKKIQKIKNILTIGLAFSFQKVKKIPINNYDIQLDFVVTNEEN